MTYVVTLAAGPGAPILTAEHLRRAARILPNPGEPRWLAPDIAADLPFAPLAEGFKPGLRAEIEALFAGERLDIAVQPTAFRRKRLLIADMDSTLIAQECIDELAAALGLGAHVAGITERAMRGEIDFEPALRERVALLRGLHLGQIGDVFAQRITLTPGGRALAQTMRRHGAVTAVVSGGFTVFTERVADALGFESHFANRLMVEDGKLTGGLEEPILGREAKRHVLVSLAYAHGLSLAETCAVGDGANDLAMIQAAGLGVAFRAKPAVAAAADARIEHGDLTTLLYFQGFSREEFAI
ncbi:MAG: phosphoserine phosphatase SerB [Beijerinckiaceae bacterium]|nr:phosphoserine phosphatase SerB [Beijerinckiaceae bacterium]